jgi:four helix bundle protein
VNRRIFPPGIRSALNGVVNPKALALQARTRAFAEKVIRFCEALPATPAADSICRQLLDSSGSADSNYRAACRARTRKEFIAKLGVVVEESDESLGWLLLLTESSICTHEAAKSLVDEANELISIFVKSEKTARRNYEAELNRQRATVHRKSR